MPDAQNGANADPGLVKQEAGGVQIKQEPGTQNAGAFQNYNSSDKNSVAASRAAQQLQAQYGMRAAGSINAIQGRIGQQQPPQPQQPGQPLSQQQQQQQQLYRQQMASATAQQQQQHPGAGAQPHLNNGQTDGAGDDGADEFEGVLMQRNAAGDVQELGRVEIDRMLHEQIAAKAKSMEGGGLMLPLQEATKHSGAPARRSAKAKGVAAFDGGDDDDEFDEDAINSDLDDPDDDRDDEEVDDEGLGHIMLCMYDKVQRVKNKWYVLRLI